MHCSFSGAQLICEIKQRHRGSANGISTKGKFSGIGTTNLSTCKIVYIRLTLDTTPCLTEITVFYKKLEIYICRLPNKIAGNDN